MSPFIFRFEAIEARIASYKYLSCPRGTTGRVHAVRLRQQPRRTNWTATGESLQEQPPERWPTYDSRDSSKHLAPKFRPRNGELPWNSGNDNHHAGSQELQPDGNELPSRVQDYRRPDHSIPKQLARARYGDMFSIPFARPEKVLDSKSTNTTIADLENALQKGDPYEILKIAVCLTSKPDTAPREGVESLSPSKFSELLRILDPEHFVGRYLRLHEEISFRHSTYKSLQFEDQNMLYGFCNHFISSIGSIMNARRRAGTSLTLIDYKYLLKCARSVGNRQSAKAIWDAMHNNTGLTVDLECYNYYLWSIVSSDKLCSPQRSKLRILPNHLDMRQWQFIPRAFAGHRVGKSGLKAQVLGIFDQMVQQKIMADEETFCLMMVAFAREGDLDGPSSLLKRIWGIDVQRLMAEGEKACAPVKGFPTDSPLRPTVRILETIVHIYGINNAIPVALRLVDFISRKYLIVIPVNVWQELLERTYMLTIRRTSKRSHEGYSAGQLQLGAVDNLWTTIISEPYNIKPTMAMYDYAITSLIRGHHWRKVQELMLEASQLHRTKVAAYGSLISKMQQSPITASQYAEWERDQAYLHLQIHRSRQYIRRWCRLFIKNSTKSMVDMPGFTAQVLPRMVEKYHVFLPRRLTYETSTGYVNLHPAMASLNKDRQSRFRWLRASSMLSKRRGFRRVPVCSRRRNQLQVAGTSRSISRSRRKRDEAGPAVINDNPETIFDEW